MKWEYQILVLTAYQHQQLNSLGREGWELVSVVASGSVVAYVAYLKRKLK